MNAEPTLLADECKVFTNYLLRQAPNSYVIDKYEKAHSDADSYVARTRFERLLGGVARSHRTLTRLADAYARLLAPRSALRKKLVLLLAILETTPPFYRSLENAGGGGFLLNFLRLGGYATAGLVSLFAGALFLLPLQLLLTITERGDRR